MIAPYVSARTINDFSLTCSKLLYSVTLAVSTDTTLTVPHSAPRFKVIMKIPYNAVVWFALNATAAIPAGATLVSTTSEMINIENLCREVKAGDVLHFFTSLSNVPLSVVFYSIGENN